MAETSNYGEPPLLGPEHKRLAAFAGNWRAEGTSYGAGQNPEAPRANGATWSSEETVRLLDGGFFLISDERATVGLDLLVTHSIIGWDKAAGQYVSHAAENHGHYRRYEIAVSGRIWTFDSGTERARIEFSEDGTCQTVFWEWRPTGDRWLPLCERLNRRIDTGAT